MAAITNDTLRKVANIIGGEDAVKVVMELKKLGEATDDQIIAQTDLKLNDVRRILFQLYNHSIVQCDRSRDENTGWFIFRWRLQPNQIEGFVNNQKRRILRILKIRLDYEKNTEFYYCNTPGCDRIPFQDAVELVFRCPVCGKPLQYHENNKLIRALEDKINQLEKGTAINTVVEKVEQLSKEEI